MKHKGKVLKLFVEWKKNMETNTGRKIKVLHSDNDKEYTSDPFLQQCRNEDIERHLTVRETLQQNGVAERMNKTVLVKVYCTLSKARFLKFFGLRYWRILAISLTSCLLLQ